MERATFIRCVMVQIFDNNHRENAIFFFLNTSQIFEHNIQQIYSTDIFGSYIPQIYSTEIVYKNVTERKFNE